MTISVPPFFFFSPVIRGEVHKEVPTVWGQRRGREPITETAHATQKAADVKRWAGEKREETKILVVKHFLWAMNEFPTPIRFFIEKLEEMKNPC